MKKSILSLLLVSGTLVIQAQTKPATKPPAKTTTKPAVKPVAVTAQPDKKLQNTNDSISYVLGEVAAYGLIQQGFGEIPINQTFFMRAVNDILGKKTPMLDDMTANTLLNNYMMKQQEKKSEVEIAKGNQFLEQNKIKPGVVTTASGLQYEVLREGTGIKPTLVDTFVAHYRGTLLDGTQFDASYDRGEPLTYPVNKVVQGWIEGLQLMPVGSKYKFYIPYNLGYGVMGSGKIPGGALLVFELELLDVKKGQ